LAKLIESRGADNDVAGAAAAHADDEAANLVIATSLETQDYRERETSYPDPSDPSSPADPTAPSAPPDRQQKQGLKLQRGAYCISASCSCRRPSLSSL